MGALTKHEIDVLIIIERTTASISVTGTLILLGTFIFIKEFRTLSNTLIFYASFANLFASVAVLIGGSALSHVDGALCQFQGFLLEMFMQSDPMWSCAMAVNVYLVFFRRYDAHRLKKLYWVYGLLCYGLPFLPALFCLIYKTEVRGKMYGNATLWCWIDNEWAAIRIYSYYAPIWLAILAALIIYVRVGVEIFQKRSQLRAMSGPGDGTMTSTSHAEPAFTGLRTTEIEVVTTAEHRGNYKSPVGTTTPAATYTRPEKPAAGRDQYTITISAQDSRPPPVTPRGALFPKRPSSVDKIKWAYTKCALLFAISILITWVPASVNRVYGLRYPTDPSFALNICSAVVLPLQGFWNTVIYFTTSLSICRRVMLARVESRKQARGSGFVVLEGNERGVRRKTESTIELSHSRNLGSMSESV
ncbi:Cyclic AMP receptor-like protein A [Lachnellula subtilissima]|uniref:Cyclic AMP receptor-like protein A n=1 Tax=Lachnellula subtilissima TaxID=602034 RepID=A0A8H8RMI3_9HELO|nr:Cyclic AMP receptor-like protein A [Lachnellula subtilissima]